MSELDFSDVREAFGRGTVIPDFATVVAAQRRRTQTTFAAIGAAALVMAIVGGAMTLAGNRTVTRPAADGPRGPLDATAASADGTQVCSGTAASARVYYFL